MAITKEKAQLIASKTVEHNWNKVQALIASGYTASYAKCGLSSKIYDNILGKIISLLIEL